MQKLRKILSIYVVSYAANYSAPIGERSIMRSVSVCVSAGDHIFGTRRHFGHVTYGRSGLVRLWRRIVMCYVFPVLWMTSFLHIS